MNGGHALIAGRAGKVNRFVKLIDGFKLGTNFSEGEYLYDTVDDFTDTLITGVTSQFDMLTSILILDYGFENEDDVGACIEEFIEVQDILNQHNLRKVKLYLITKNSDLYDRMKQDYHGRDVLIYPNTAVFYTSNIRVPYIYNVMSGVDDGKALRPSKKDTLTKIQRVEREKSRLEEDARQVEKETLEYEKDIPYNKLDSEDYIDSAKSNVKRDSLEKERLALARKAERLGISYQVDDWGEMTFYAKDGSYIPDLEEYERNISRKPKDSDRRSGKVNNSYADAEIDSGDEIIIPQEPNNKGRSDERYSTGLDIEPEAPIHNGRGSNSGGHIEQSYPVGSVSPVNGTVGDKRYKPFEEKVRVAHQDTGASERVESLSTVKMLYNDLLSDGMSLVEDKLHEDSVVMAVSSVKGSGGSGVVAQIAEVYAMLGRKVIVIDLDLNGRGQMAYFKNYDKKVSENKGIANALVNVFDGGYIPKASVSVNSRIDVCGISTSVGMITERYKETLSRNLNSVLEDAKGLYDIILLDIPMEDFSLYIDRGFSQVERFLFVTENKEYSIDRLFRQYLSEFVDSHGMLVSDIFNNATIVLNKYSNTSRDQRGYLIDKKWLKEKLYEKGAPYDVILVSGEIPFVSGFEEQYLTNQRYVWKDSGYMATIKNMLKESI